MLWGSIVTENKICPNCGHSNKFSARHCSKCGESIKKHKLDTIEKILIAVGFLLIVFIISYSVISSETKDLEIKYKDVIEVNKLNLSELNANKLKYSDLNKKYISLLVEKKKIEKELSDCNLEYENYKLQINSDINDLIVDFSNFIGEKICSVLKFDLNIDQIYPTGFKNYYNLGDNSNCKNNSLFYSPILSKSKIDQKMALTINTNTKGIINLFEDQNYTIFVGLYFNDLAMDYNGEIFRFGEDTNYLYLYKDANILYFRQSVTNHRIGYIYDINYFSVNYFKIGKFIGDYGQYKDTDIIFIKNYTDSKHNNSIDGIYSRNFSPIPEISGHGIDATIIPGILRTFEFGGSESKSDRVTDLLYLKVYNQDYSDKDLNYFLEN